MIVTFDLWAKVMERNRFFLVFGVQDYVFGPNLTKIRLAISEKDVSCSNNKKNNK